MEFAIHSLTKDVTIQADTTQELKQIILDLHSTNKGTIQYFNTKGQCVRLLNQNIKQIPKQLYFFHLD